MKARFLTASVAFGSAFSATQGLRAEISLFVNDFAGWQAAAGPFTTVDFVEDAPAAPVLFNHFANFGVLLNKTGYFDPALPYWYRFTNESGGEGPFLRDAGGLSSASDQGFRFLAPVNSFGYLPLTTDSGSFFHLFLAGAYLGTAGGAGQPIGAFRGIYSTVAFDEVRFASMRYLDNIYFSTIPTPGIIPLLTLAATFGGRRRR
jgi:hypothetical protein